MIQQPEQTRPVCSFQVEERLKGLHELQKATNEGQNRVIMGLMALVAASLGIRFTETDITAEILRTGSFVMFAGCLFLLLVTAWERLRNGKRFHPALLLLIVGLWGFGVPAMIAGRFWLPMEAVAGLRVILGVAAAWMAWDIVGVNALLEGHR